MEGDNITLSESSGGGSEGPVSAAPMPPQTESDVISIFSDAYTDVAGTDFFPDWGQSTTFEQIDLMGDAAIKYGNANYQGIAIGSGVDASTMESIHIDVWSDDYAVIPFFLISQGSGEKSVNLAVNANQWNSIDIPLSAFTDQGLAINDIFQFKFDVQPNNGGTFYIDNLYFFKSSSGSGGGSATEPSSAAPTPGLDAANVISLFSEAYTDVAVDTWRTDWSAADLEDVMVDGNAVKKYSSLDFVGIETVSSQIDASAMTQFHLDVWSADFTEFKVKLVDFGPNGVYDGGGDDVEHEIVIASPAQGEWVSLDLDLSDFTGLTTRANIAQIILVGAPTANNTVYVDNVYFHN